MTADQLHSEGNSHEETVTAAASSDQRRDADRERGSGDRLDELLEQFGESDEYKLYLERIDADGKPAYLGPVAFDENLLDTVQSRWGGGQYSGKITGKGSRYVTRIPSFRIAGAPRDPNTPTPAPAENPQQLAVILAGVMEGFKSAIVEAVRSVAPAPAPAVDPVAQIKAVMEVAQMMTPKPAPRESLRDQIETLTAVFDLKEQLRGGGDDGGVAATVRELAPLVKDALANSHRPAGAPDTVIHDAPAPRAPATPQGASWLRPFLGYKNMLLSLADGGKDASLYGDLIVDNLTDEQAAAIVEANDAGTLDRDLFEAVPELNRSPERRQFAGALLKQVRTGLLGDEKKTPRRRPKAKKTAKRTNAAPTPGASNGT